MHPLLLRRVLLQPLLLRQVLLQPLLLRHLQNFHSMLEQLLRVQPS